MRDRPKQVYKFDWDIPGWMEYFQLNEPHLGATDIFCAGRIGRIAAAAGFAATTEGLITPDGSVFSRVVVIFPADTLNSQSEVDLSETFFSAAMEYLREYFANAEKTIDPERTKEFLRRRISLQVARNNQSRDLVEFLKSLPSSTAVFIVGAELYLPEHDTLAAIDSYKRIPREKERTNLEEDSWVQTTHQLASQVASLSQSQKLFTLLFVQRYGPVKAQNSDLLKSIDNCGVVTVEAPDVESTEERLILENADRWLALAREQKIDEVIKEIDELPFSSINRAVVKAQCLMAAHRPLLSFKIIEAFVDQIKNGTPQAIFNAAKIARSAGQYSTAVSLLRAGVRDHLSEPELNLALNLAISLGEKSIETSTSEQLIRIYPRSPSSISYRFKKARSQGDFASLSEEIDSLSGSIETNEEIHHIYLLASAFGANEVPDYKALIGRVASIVPSRRFKTVLACATHALRRGDFQQAAGLCLSVEWPPEFHEDAAWRMVNALESLLLRKRRLDDTRQDSTTRSSQTSEFETLFIQCLDFILSYLSLWPNNGSIRAAVYRVLSAETAGLEGLVYLTNAILNAPSAQVIKANNAERVPTADEQLPALEFEALYRDILTEIPKPIMVGLGKLPRVRANPPLAPFFTSIVSALQGVSLKGVADDTDLWFLHVLLHIAILVSRELGRDYESDLIAMAAAGMSASGHYQSARNLGELALQLSAGSSSEQRRAAWLCYSDVYLRGHNPLEALIGLGCALRCSNAKISPTQRYQELVLSCRILRELRLFPLALEILSSARQEAVNTDASDQAILRLDYMELALRFRMLIQGKDNITDSTIPALVQLANRLVDLNQRNREQGNEILPTALLLAQISGQLDRAGKPPAPEVRKELAASFELVDTKQAEMLRVFASAKPTPDSIETFSAALSRTRYSEDIGTDVAFITLLSRRALDAVAESGNASKTLFLIEWLTDLSLNTLDSNRFIRSEEVEVTEDTLRNYTEWMSRAPGFAAHEDELVQLHELDKKADPSVQISNRLPTSHEDLARFAREISKDNITIHSIGLTEAGSLVRVTAAGGDLSVAIEPNNIFDYRAHKQWGKTYPYGYAKLMLNDPFALSKMERSLSGIGISPGSASQPILLVADVSLQDIPPNLLLVDGKIRGLDFPSAAAPSLTWLKAVRSSVPPSSNDRNAWIPASGVAGDVLLRLSEDLGDTLGNHGFSISHDPLMPGHMSNSDVAIIGAHGGLQAENEWFRVVADERFTRLTARDVAAKLRGSKIVVLFVCSGGRLDPHPYASSTVGLPQLLLDYGCRTVVASPWPLDVRVASVWLPEFLRALETGERVISANYQANRRVAERFSFHPTLCLAMNVFGDPFTQAA